jgi:hypothetical protein
MKVCLSSRIEIWWRSRKIEAMKNEDRAGLWAFCGVNEEMSWSKFPLSSKLKTSAGVDGFSLIFIVKRSSR